MLEDFIYNGKPGVSVCFSLKLLLQIYVVLCENYVFQLH